MRHLNLGLLNWKIAGAILVCSPLLFLTLGSLALVTSHLVAGSVLLAAAAIIAFVVGVTVTFYVRQAQQAMTTLVDGLLSPELTELAQGISNLLQSGTVNPTQKPSAPPVDPSNRTR